MERGWPQSPAFSLFDGRLSVPQTPQTPWPSTPGNEWQPATPSQDYPQHDGYHGGAHSAGLHQVYGAGPYCEPVEEMQDNSWAHRDSSSVSSASTEAPGALDRGISLEVIPQAVSLRRKGLGRAGVPEKSGRGQASADTACPLLCPPCTARLCPARKSSLPLPFHFSS